MANPFANLFRSQDTSATLAILQPAVDSNAPISLTLTTTNLRETSYEVISYDRNAEVDEGADAVTVEVDGADLPVPRALETALRTFRRKEKPRTLWADLLVGRTPEERSLQAAVQRQVLSGAEKTLCWLGPSPEHERDAKASRTFDVLREMARRYARAAEAAGIPPDTNLSRTTAAQMEALRTALAWSVQPVPGGTPDVLVQSVSDLALWNDVYAVLGSPYWKCARCIPEIVLARDAVIARGRGNLRWPAYVEATRAMPFLQAALFPSVPLLPGVMHGFEAANSIEIAGLRRRLGESGESVELLPMIQTARDNAAKREPSGGRKRRDGEDQGGGTDGKKGKKDPREIVFSMITVATPSARIQHHDAGPQPLPAIDYTKSTRRVFTEAARYSVLERQDLLLWYNERPPCDSRLRRGRFPSWVPDFTAVPHKNTLLTPNGGMRAWWDGLPAPLRRITISAETDTLRLRARPLDRIVHVSPILDAANHRRVILSEFEKLPAPGSAEETLEQRNERFWRTLVLNAGAGYGPRLRDNAVAESGNLGPAFRSLVAEETVLRALGCATVAELQTAENAARMRASPELMALVSLCGRAAPFASLVAHHAAGRRFFRTATGRFGVSAIEDVRCVEGALFLNEEGEYWDDEPEEDDGGEGEVSGDAAQEQETTASTSRNTASEDGSGAESSQPPPPPSSRMGHLMADPMARSMMESFQQYLQARDPQAAQLTSRMMRGELPGGEEQQRQRQQEEARARGGVREGDLVVAAVGGFFPYVLRPRGGGGGEGADTASGQDSSTYEFVGDCYLHGAMDGEDFRTASGFTIDTAQLVEINIV